MDKRRFFDEAAAGFSEDFSRQDMQKIAWMLRRWRLEPGMRVLEPGCGAGQLTLLLADVLGPHGAVVALDFSREMIASARRARFTFLVDHWPRRAWIPSIMSGFMSSAYPVALWLVE